MNKTNLPNTKRKTFLSFLALFLVLFNLAFIESIPKEFNSLRLLNQEFNQKESIIESSAKFHESSNKRLNFYLENIILKKKDILIRYLMDENDIQDVLSKIKCLWLDTKTYMVYNFYTLDKLIKNE